MRYAFQKTVLVTSVVFLMTAGLCRASSAGEATPRVAALPDIALELVVSDIGDPVAITHAGDGSGRLFITLQPGQIIIYDGTQVLPAPFLDIRSIVSCCGERGLLSVAFHPDYENNGFFYVNYTDNLGDTVIARYTVSGDPNLADLSSALVLLNISQPFGNHNGGQLQFGPDGYLYIGMGDGGSGGDPGNRAQDLNDLLGKMLRINVDGAEPYEIPATNPFVGNPQARDEIWALGLRNPWRFSFDRLTGDLFIGDVGQSSWEEVDFQAASSAGEENYGWRLMEGSSCFNPPNNCNDGTLILPVAEYDHALGNCSITGGYGYRGARYPELAGIYFYGDYCSGRIWGFTTEASELLDTSLSITSFGEDEEGELYVADIDPNGAIYRIVSALTCDLTLDYSDDILNLNLELGTPEPVTWNLWVSIQNAVIKVWSLPLPVVTPPISSTIPAPAFPQVGMIGMLTTLITAEEGLICSSWATVDTGTPESMPTGRELERLFRNLSP